MCQPTPAALTGFTGAKGGMLLKGRAPEGLGSGPRHMKLWLKKTS
jgi:hypothetical protein